MFVATRSEGTCKSENKKNVQNDVNEVAW